jgi:hypothetical protein
MALVNAVSMSLIMYFVSSVNKCSHT